MKRTSIVLSVAVLALSASASADAPSDLEALLEEPVVSTASKSAETQSVAPATTSVLTAEDLRRYGIRSLDEALNFLALGIMTSNPLHSVDVGARGVLLTADFGNHVLLLVDGHAMNEQWDGTAYFERGAGIPFELIDHIEVILGPGSVLYGSNAMLAVINIITKRAKEFGGLHVVGETELPTAVRAAAGFGHEFTLFGRRAEVTTEIEYYTQDGPAFRFGPQHQGKWGGLADRSYYTQIPDGYLRFSIGDFEFALRAESYKRATPYVNAFNQFSGEFNNPDNYEIDRWLTADLKHKVHLGSIATLTSRLYGDLYDYNQLLTNRSPGDCLDGESQGCRTDLLGASKWAGLEEQASFDWLHNGRLTTLIGVDARLRLVSSRLDYTDLATGDHGGTTGAYQHGERAIAIYGEQTARPIDWLNLNVGARFDADERFGNRVSPRAVAAVSPWKGATVKGIYAEAFRAPTSYESFFTDSTSQPPATNLKPETVRSVEASFEQRFGAHRLLIGGFRSWWSNMVLLELMTPQEIAQAIAAGQLQTGVTTAYEYKNVSRIDNGGYNAAVEGSFLNRRLRYAVNVTGAYTRRTDPGAPPSTLTVAPQFFWNARAAYDFGGSFPTLGAAMYYLAARPADRAADGGFTPTPIAPPQFEVRGTLTGPTFLRGLTYRTSVDYAFGSHSPYVAGPVQAATPNQPSAQLAPVDQFKVAVGLQYDLPL